MGVIDADDAATVRPIILGEGRVWMGGNFFGGLGGVEAATTAVTELPFARSLTRLYRSLASVRTWLEISGKSNST